MNNDKSSHLIARYSYFSVIPIQIHWKDYQSTKEKVSGPNPLNHDYIYYSDIQI